MFGFFTKKSQSPIQAEEDKNLDLLKKKVRKIQIHSSKLVNDVMTGEYRSAFKGRGMEFDTVREYHEGDEPRMIDWNVTARMGQPYVKNYIEERELTILFVVDVSASGKFGSVHQSKQELIAELCAVLAFNAIRLNDRIGLILFSDQIELYIPPKKGKTHVLRVIRELLAFRPSHNRTDIQNALSHLNRIHKKRAVVFLVSDFLDNSEYLETLNLTNRRHDVVAIEVKDPAEKELPDIGIVEFSDIETGKSFILDSSHKQWRTNDQKRSQNNQEFRDSKFKKFGVDHLKIQSDIPFERTLSLFFKKRAAKLRTA